MKKIIALTLTAFLLIGCSHLPFQEKSRQEILEQKIGSQGWWLVFNDPLLNNLVNQLNTQNIDIQIAKARLSEARALKIPAQSGFFPSVDSVASASRSDVSIPQIQDIAQAGFDAKWEVDLFGQTRARVSAAEANRLSRIAGVGNARSIVIADLVRAVIEWRQSLRTISKTKDLIKVQDDQVTLLNARVKAGLIDSSFLERARAQRAQTSTSLPQAEAAANAARFQIERLLAVRDGSVETILATDTMPSIRIPNPEEFGEITIETLRSRPDIAIARAELLGAEANLDGAEAALWPQISLSAFFGIQDGSDGVRLSSNPVWSLSSSLSAPLLNFGKLRSEVKAANARTQAAALNFENVVNLALQETKTALSDYLNGLNAVAAQELALQARKDTVRIAKTRFDRGLTDMTDLTTAQAELDSANLSLIRQETETAIAYIRLQKALSKNISNNNGI